jgi:succinyl-diaminopimelate desuccinylase
MSVDPVDLAARLIACPSVTPADAGAQDVLAEVLQGLGFDMDSFEAGAAPHGPIRNLIATRGTGGPHLAFAGHTDVVPPGDGWTTGAFEPALRGGLLHGRGAVDMKGAIAAFVAATDEVRDHAGTISLLVTGDEEGPAIHGTRAILDRMAARGICPDMILVGEPTSEAALGDTIKIGRRGSLNAWIEVPGTQGHVAYPHLADNPVPALVRILSALDAWRLDEGNAWFQPSNLEVTDIEVGNPATNVIPARARARLNIRFNDLHDGAGLEAEIRRVVAAHAPAARVDVLVSGEAFLTEPGPLSALVADAIGEVTGLAPKLSTSGGTSDARFLCRVAPTIEFGLPNATMHKLDEAAAVDDIRALARIYACVLRRALSAAA